MKRFIFIGIQLVLFASAQACTHSVNESESIKLHSTTTEVESLAEALGDTVEIVIDSSIDEPTKPIESDSTNKIYEVESLDVVMRGSESVEDPAEDEQRGVAAFVLWDNLLQKYVSNDGVVNYKSIKADPSFERCLSVLQGMKDDGEWTEDKQKAYWINVYNAFTIKLIVDNFPLNSINDIKEPWDKKFIEIGNIKYSLNQIENEILRPKYKDARVHFAINCASYSCPPLSNRAYFPESLDKVLTQMTKNFLRDEKRNSISAEKIVISKIFEWYMEDFDNGKGIIPFLNMYSKTIINVDATVEYMDYSWKLNGK